VQVDPIKPTLKAPESKRLKLKCDEPLLNFAFNFNLRRYMLEPATLLFAISMLRRLARPHTPPLNPKP
jgi:hypothetical protein